MNEHDATEQAYKNGYQQGVKDFAERLKNKSKKRVSDNYGARVFIQDIDNLAKEMGVEL